MKFKNESGRSMLEMLGVILVVALLTLGAITGYSYLIQRHRRQETVKDVSQLALGIKTADLARRFAQTEGVGKAIPAGKVVRGPKVEGGVLVLPDSDKSFAVTMSLKNGAFAAALQLAPGTCSEMFEALKSDDMTVWFNNGAKRAETASEFKAQAEAWMKDVFESEKDPSCMPNGEGKCDINTNKEVGIKSTTKDARAMASLAKALEDCDKTGLAVQFVWDCPQGSSSYVSPTGNECRTCPISWIDKNQDCCEPSKRECGEICFCPDGKKACVDVGGKKECLECGTNVDCKRKYDLFARHVCTADHVCVECEDDTDCSPTTGYKDSAEYAGRDLKYCSNQRCIECENHYQSGEPHPCRTAEKPVCEAGRCERCPEGSRWDATQQKCVCDTGVMAPDGTCVFCWDSVPVAEQDEGCYDSTKPICYNPSTAGTYAFWDGDTGAPGTECVQCLVDEHCPENEFCKADHTCGGCPEGTIWNATAKECAYCVDDATRGEKDRGCGSDRSPAVEPLCEPVNGTGNGTNGIGASCKKCYNNNFGENEDSQDDGCSSDTKLCEAADAKYGTECKKCRNNNDRSKRDAGCGDADPLCRAASGAYGTECYVCQDNKSNGETDDGCGAGLWSEKPFCDSDVLGLATNDGTNAYGSSCKKCLNNYTEAENDAGKIDLGCTAAAPRCSGSAGTYGNECSTCAEGTVPLSDGSCGKCRDSEDGTNQDEGCREDPHKPICYTNPVANNKSGNRGDECVFCYDSAEGQTKDEGCTDSTKPICKGPANSNDGSNSKGTECGRCVDSVSGVGVDLGCGGTDQANICVYDNCGDTRGSNGARTCWHNHGSSEIGTRCVQCIFDGDCRSLFTDGSKPKCDNSGASATFTCQPDPCSNGCLNKQGECISLNSYQDIVRGADGQCECVTAVRTRTVTDYQGFDYGKRERDKDKNCSRLQSYRQREYKMNVNFYCPRYMHVSDSMEADDFVASSTPSGIGKNSPAKKNKTWEKAHDNTITPKVSDNTIQTGVAKLVIQDRWLGHVGMSKSGFFYFTLTKDEPSAGKETVPVSVDWAEGSSKSSPVGKYVCKKGAKSTTKKKCSEYCHNWEGPY